MDYIKYEGARPGQIRDMIARAPVAYVPVGALEWHGEHNPLGLDGLKARYLCEQAAARTGGVVFPPIFWGAFDTMPFPFTFHFERRHFAPLVRQTLDQLAAWDVKLIVILTGHYPPSLIALLRRECRRFNRRQRRALAIGAPEMVFAHDLDYFGDHAGAWETSIMMAIAPELVDVSVLPAGLTAVPRMTDLGVMGQDPKTNASPEKGRAAIARITENLAALVGRALTENTDAAIEDAYRFSDRALRVLSPRILHVIREALDVHSLRELIRYGLASRRLPTISKRRRSDHLRPGGTAGE
jgi:creatinine amidohydrolase